MNSETKDESDLLHTITFIVEVSAERLKSDREQSSTPLTADVEAQLKEQEAKLIKQFARILHCCHLQAKRSILSPVTAREYAEKFFGIVNVHPKIVQEILTAIPDLLRVLRLSDLQIQTICAALTDVTDEHMRRLTTALTHLRNYTNRWIIAGQEPPDDHSFSIDDLCWCSFDCAPNTSSLANTPSTNTSARASVGTCVAGPSGTASVTRPPPQQPVMRQYLDDRVGAADRRSVSESGVDSGASDSGVGSNVSQNSLPTTTPPASPGFPAMVAIRSMHANQHNQPQHESFDSASVSRKSSTRGSIKRSRTPPTQLFASTKYNTQKLSNRGRSGTPLSSALSPGSTPSRATSSVSCNTATSINMQRSRSAESNLPNRLQAPNQTSVSTAQSHTQHTNTHGLSAMDINHTVSAHSNLHTHSAERGGVGGSAHLLSPSSVTMSMADAVGLSQSQQLSAVSVTDTGPSSLVTSRSEHVLSPNHNSNMSNLSLRRTGAPASLHTDMGNMSMSRSPSVFAPSPGPASASYLPDRHGSVSAGAGQSLLGAPKSPRTGRILHEIPHVWDKCRGSLKKQCTLCRKVLGVFMSVSPEKCQRCKSRVHGHCKALIPLNTCGLTSEHIKLMFEQYLEKDEGGWTTSPQPDTVGTPASALNNRSLNSIDEGNAMATVAQTQTAVFTYPESSSSTNSSAPSTPAHINPAPATQYRAMTAPPHSANLLGLGIMQSTLALSPSAHTQFLFPAGVSSSASTPEVHDLPHIREPHDYDLSTSRRQEPRSSFVNSADSDMTIRVSSYGSGTATHAHESSDGDDFGSWPQTGSGEGAGADQSSVDYTPAGEDGGEAGGSHTQGQLEPGAVRNRQHWSRGTLRGPSTSWRDVTIPFSEIVFQPDSLLGVGRFGPVHRGYWHQDVAVKFLNMDHVHDHQKMLSTFKQEVESFRNTRHDNIVLFLGYCLDPPNLAIVMNLCKGRTLYNIIHRNRDRMDIQKAVNIAQQVTQALSYLHQRQIVHRDLRTKNIFVEPNNKIMITDFGLFSMQRLRTAQLSREEATDPFTALPSTALKLTQQGTQSCLHVPERWLCYVAPEIARALRPLDTDTLVSHLPFSYASDAYAFGTVWYELLVGDFPFNQMAAHSVLWQVGKGIKPALCNLQAPPDIKDVLVRCWAYAAGERPKFDELFRLLERMPKKRLVRSPSHPVQMLSRSAESMF